MKKKITLILLPFFIFSIIGWQWMFFVKLFSLETKEWGSEMQKSRTEVVVVSKSNARSTFFINAHELVHDGKLYDVKLKERDGESWICYCERDGAEENLLSSFDVRTKDAFDHAFSANSKTQKPVKLSLFESAIPLRLVATSPDSNAYQSFFEPPFRLSSVVDSFFVPPDLA